MAVPTFRRYTNDLVRSGSASFLTQGAGSGSSVVRVDVGVGVSGAVMSVWCRATMVGT